MKKYKLIKTLTLAAPVLITPLVAASCNSKNDNGSKESTLTPSGKVASYYVDALAKTLKAELNSIASDVTSTAAKASTTSAPQSTLDITPQVTKAINDAKKIAVSNPSAIDKIVLSFKGTSNLKVEKNSENKYILTAYPGYYTNISEQQMLTTTLSLSLSSKNKNTQTITNTYTIANGFKMYNFPTTGTPGTYGIAQTNNGQTLYVASLGGGVEIGNRQTDGTYKWTSYTKGLPDTLTIGDIAVSSDGNTVYAATGDQSSTGGIFIGTKQPDGTYKFKLNKTPSLIDVEGIYVSPDGNTIYAAGDGGASIGTKQPDGTYKFKSTGGFGEGANNYCIHPSPDGKTLYVGGLYLYAGVKNGDTYTFKKITNIIAYRLAMSADGNTIYTVSDQSSDNSLTEIKKNENNYTVKTFNSPQLTGLGRSVEIFNNDTVYIGANRGLTVATKNGNDFTFKSYNNGLDKDSSVIYGIAIANNKKSIYLSTSSYVAISRTEWF